MHGVTSKYRKGQCYVLKNVSGTGEPVFLRNSLYDCMKLNFGTINVMFLKSFWFLTLPAGKPKNLNMELSKRSSILRSKICRSKTQRIAKTEHAFHTRNPLVLFVRCLPVSQAIPWRATRKNKRVQKSRTFQCKFAYCKLFRVYSLCWCNLPRSDCGEDCIYYVVCV